MFSKPSYLLACSLCLIAVIGLTRIYDAAPPQAIGLTIMAGTLFILGLFRFNPTFRKTLDSRSVEELVGWHAIRAPIGAGFLVLAGEEMLPELFAHRAGYGDMITAFAGVVLIAITRNWKDDSLKHWLYGIWNIAGIVDLLLAVGTGVYMAIRIPGSMVWIARLPLLLIPTLILPILFATHFLMIKRLLFDPKERTGAERAGTNGE